MFQRRQLESLETKERTDIQLVSLSLSLSLSLVISHRDLSTPFRAQKRVIEIRCVN